MKINLIFLTYEVGDYRCHFREGETDVQRIFPKWQCQVLNSGSSLTLHTAPWVLESGFIKLWIFIFPG